MKQYMVYLPYDLGKDTVVVADYYTTDDTGRILYFYRLEEGKTNSVAVFRDWAHVIRL